MARYWVAGASGFLGSHLVASLAARGHTAVATASRAASVGRQEVLPVDALDPVAVERSARGCDVAFVAFGKVSRDPKDAELLHRLHVVGTQRVLAGLRAGGVRRVVYTSTSGTVAVSEGSQEPATEDSPPPTALIGHWPYYRTKLYGERAALEASQPGQFEVVVVNPSLLLGPGDQRGSSTADVRRFLEGEIAMTPRGGLALVDVRDVATAMLKAAEVGRAGQRYLLNAANWRVSEFFSRLARVSGVPAPRVAMPRGRGAARFLHSASERVLRVWGRNPAVDCQSLEMAQCYWYCDSAQAQKELGFSPRDPLETLRDTVSDLIERGVALPRSTNSRTSARIVSPSRQGLGGQP